MFKGIAIFHNACFDHFTHQVISFTGPFSHTGKHRYTGICFSDIIDQLLDQYCFTHTSTTKQTDLTAFCIWFDQVDHFDTSK